MIYVDFISIFFTVANNIKLLCELFPANPETKLLPGLFKSKAVLASY